MKTELTEVLGTIICTAVLIVAFAGLIKIAPLISHGIEQIQTYECLSRPWLDRSHGC